MNTRSQIFLGYLKAQLLLSNYLVATPEPDIGEDIWVANNNKNEYQIYPAQIKSAFMYQWVKMGTVKRYVVNIIRRFEATLRSILLFYWVIRPRTQSRIVSCGLYTKFLFFRTLGFSYENQTDYNKKLSGHR